MNNCKEQAKEMLEDFTSKKDVLMCINILKKATKIDYWGEYLYWTEVENEIKKL
jgi:hypothetical protein